MLDLLAILAGTANAIPDLPAPAIRIRVGGIVGTLAWAAAAYWYRDDIGYALRSLTRDD